MRIYKFIIAVILLIILKNSSCLAADTTFVARYQTIFDLEDQWQVFDEDYQAYIPYIKEVHGNPYALHFDLNLNNYKGYHLLIEFPQPVYLFIQAQLYKQFSAGDKVILNIDSLRRVHDQPKLFFSLYNNNRHTILPSASIIYNPEISLSLDTQSSLLVPLKQRANSNLADFLIVAAVLILALYAFLWNYHPKAFSSYYNLASVFSFSVKEDTVLISRPLSRLNMLFILTHSFLLSFLYILIQKSSGRLLVYDRFLQPINTFGELFLFFIVLGLFIFILLIIKYFFILFLGNLFNLSKIIHIHFYEYLLFSRIFYSVAVPVIFVVFITYPWVIPLAVEELILIIIIFNFIRVLVINLALNKLTSVKNLYLFSYLCATELIPLLIGIKVLVSN